MPVPTMIRSCLAVLLLCLAGLPLRAEGWSYLSGGPGGQRAAATCELAEGGLFCLSLTCSDRQELGFALQFPIPVPQPVEGGISVDGAPAVALRFERPVTVGGPAVAPWSAERDLALVEALRRGQRAVLRYDSGSGAREQVFSLAGSARAMGQVMAACPAPAAAGMPARGDAAPAVPPGSPLAYAAARMEPLCAAAGQPFDPAAGLIVPTDLDRDGQPDAVIDWGRGGCGTRAGFCRGEDCEMTFLHNRGAAGYVPILTVAGQDHEVVTVEGFDPNLTIRAAASDCGRSEGPDCAVIYAIRPGGMPELIGRF
ncbi:hypothetical protein [Mangrovicoccus algicola]|uniref:Uncharacterized protein n=1 Tax=Mangrovicoccus algicola TaxID=2771008 RepID=A0A8J6ZCD4_9RHOB|nr:hypothetical protein [Mangrovicoccus algicola]MBE3639866.1 hypothetical protein [Mangrovicoccus algicola]